MPIRFFRAPNGVRQSLGANRRRLDPSHSIASEAGIASLFVAGSFGTRRLSRPVGLFAHSHLIPATVCAPTRAIGSRPDRASEVGFGRRARTSEPRRNCHTALRLARHNWCGGLSRLIRWAAGCVCEIRGAGAARIGCSPLVSGLFASRNSADCRWLEESVLCRGMNSLFQMIEMRMRIAAGDAASWRKKRADGPVRSMCAAAVLELCRPGRRRRSFSAARSSRGIRITSF